MSYDGLNGVDERHRNLYTTSDATSSIAGDFLDTPFDPAILMRVSFVTDSHPVYGRGL